MTKKQLNRLICWRLLLHFRPALTYWRMFVYQQRN